MKAEEILTNLGFDKDDSSYYGEYYENTISGEQLERYFSIDVDNLQKVKDGEITHVHLIISMEKKFVETYTFDHYPTDQDVANSTPEEDDFEGVLEWLATEYVLQEEVVLLDCSVQELVDYYNFSFSQEDDELFESDSFDGLAFSPNYKGGELCGVSLQAEIISEDAAELCEVTEGIWEILCCTDCGQYITDYPDENGYTVVDMTERTVQTVTIRNNRIERVAEDFPFNFINADDASDLDEVLGLLSDMYAERTENVVDVSVIGKVVGNVILWGEQ